MPNQNPALQALQGVTFNMSDPRNKMPKRLDAQRGQSLMGTPMESLGAFEGGLDLRDELSENLANTPSSDSYAIDRLKGLLGNTNRSLHESFIPEQMEQTNQWHRDDASARTQGFGSSGSTPETMGQSAAQSREIYRRNIEAEKMRQPLEQTRMEQAGGLQRAQEQSRGLVGQANAVAGHKEKGYDLLRDALSGGSVPPGGSLSVSGIGSVRNPVMGDPPNAAFDRIREARTQYEVAKQQAPSGFWGAINPFDNDQTGFRKKALDDAIMGYLGQYKGTNPLAKTKAWELYNNPEIEDMSAEEIIGALLEQAPDAISDLDEDGLAELQEILMTIKGR